MQINFSTVGRTDIENNMSSFNLMKVSGRFQARVLLRDASTDTPYQYQLYWDGDTLQVLSDVLSKTPTVSMNSIFKMNNDILQVTYPLNHIYSLTMNVESAGFIYDVTTSKELEILPENFHPVIYYDSSKNTSILQKDVQTFSYPLPYSEHSFSSIVLNVLGVMSDNNKRNSIIMITYGSYLEGEITIVSENSSPYGGITFSVTNKKTLEITADRPMKLLAVQRLDNEVFRGANY